MILSLEITKYEKFSSRFLSFFFFLFVVDDFEFYFGRSIKNFRE